jgi:hypothetical protein
MFARDLHCGGQMFQAIRLDDPRRMVAENVADPGLLGTGEHGAAMVAERAGVGQRGPYPGIQGVGSGFFSGLRQSCGVDSLRAKMIPPG